MSLQIDEDGITYLLYTMTLNLRKYCNSRATSILWNLIFLLNEAQLKRLIPELQKALRGVTDKSDLKDVFSQVVDEVCTPGEYALQGISSVIPLLTADEVETIFDGVFVNEVEHVGKVTEG